MQKSLHITMVRLSIVLVVLFLLYSCCCPKQVCEGYTGTLTNKNSISLVNTNHFIPKDMIIEWTARYQANKALIKNDSLPPAGDILGDSCSFNSCFVKALLCRNDCIGLRVLHGMDENMKVRIILVGIKPDYSTLYIPNPTYCVPPKPMFLSRGDTVGSKGEERESGPPGGVDFGQKPS